MPRCRTSRYITGGLRVIGLPLFLLAVSGALLGGSWLSQRFHAAATAKTPPAAVTLAQNKKSGRSVETELITLRRNGFEPSEIKRPAGQFILMVENRGGGAANLRLLREAGERLHEVRSTREQPDWNELEDLPPGRYVLTEADHPSWSCRITVTPR